VWNHVQISYHRDASGVVTYDQVMFNCTIYNFENATGNAAMALGWAAAVLVTNLQIYGSGAAAASVNVIADNMTVYRWMSTQTASPTTVMPTLMPTQGTTESAVTSLPALAAPNVSSALRTRAPVISSVSPSGAVLGGVVGGVVLALLVVVVVVCSMRRRGTCERGETGTYPEPVDGSEPHMASAASSRVDEHSTYGNVSGLMNADVSSEHGNENVVINYGQLPDRSPFTAGYVSLSIGGATE
jgi:hypothetical protein